MTVGIFELLGDRFELVAVIEGDRIEERKEGMANALRKMGVVDEASAMHKLGNNFYLLAVQITKEER